MSDLRDLATMPSEGGRDLVDLRRRAHESTPARLFVAPPSSTYPIVTWLGLRSDHAVARDAVAAELDLARDLGSELVTRHQLFAVTSQAKDRREYLLRPDLGRRLSQDAAAMIARRCPHTPALQIVIGDGLSLPAVATQVPSILPLLTARALEAGWQPGQPFVVRHCRVGIMNAIGELLAPEVVVLLIGERPGLACADSLSAYMAFSPQPGDTDARRNLISNIHARGVTPAAAVRRILALAEAMRRTRASGVTLKESLPALDSGDSPE